METIGTTSQLLNPKHRWVGSVAFRGEVTRADQGLIHSSAVLTDTISATRYQSAGRFGPIPRHKPDSQPE